MPQNDQKNYASGMYTLVMVFFFWGFVAASNDILIPVFKEKLHLEQWQSQMISFAFYVAYTVGSIIYFFVSKISGGDILNKMGYKNGIALGLGISAIGTLLFYPAAQTASFSLMITGLFIVGLGFSLQQTAANTLALLLGDPRKGSQRLSLAGGVNNFGTTIGPVIVSLAIFGTVSSDGVANVASIEAVKTPYLVLGALFILVAFIFKISNLPDKIMNEEDTAISSPTDVSTEVHPTEGKSKKSALGYTQLLMGMIAIFLYVGVEVSTASNLPEYMRHELHVPTENIAPFVSLFWASLMIGRWTSSIGAFDLSSGIKGILRFIIPYVAFYVFLIVNKLANHDITPFFVYAAIILVLIFADLASKGNPAKQLLIFSLLAITALCIGIFSTGMVSVFAFISVGLFCSTLWPCIYTLAIAGLGKHTNEGASFLIMMIMGGGVISLLQGYVASEDILGIKYSYFVGVACFVYLAFYAWRVSGILRRQGVDFENAEAAGGH